ncbi:MAG: TIGR02757 family protein [Alistipes sp.]|nr:TIGR02757 family protein [Alistipes sp.]
MSSEEMRDLLERLHDRYNNESFIEADPISVPHSFTNTVDREIAGFLAATIAWGNRRAIVQSAHRMMRYMDNAPEDFVRNATEGDMEYLRTYVHRTFNGVDFQDFVRGLRHIITEWGSIGNYFESRYAEHGDLRPVFSDFRRDFFNVDHDAHCEKHLSSIDKGAACKRLCMYLRWFVRRDDRGVDFGLWRGIPMSALYMPLDIHTGRMGRNLGLLSRKQSDWKAVEELTASLRELSAEDPVRYDYSLFGLGISGDDI